jgi:alpha-D-xyloside xylohydrolase
MREFRWCDFTWDERVFPDPAGMLRRLKERGLKVCVWINPYIGQLSSLFGETRANGYLLKTAKGDVYQTDLWQPGMGIVDFSNPAACEWYSGKLRGLLDSGVDCFKTDFGERIPVDVVWADGSDPMKMHNFYSYLYNKVVFDTLREYRGEGEAVVFARSATAGCQQVPVQWGGDCYSSFESMAETLRGGLSLGLSGFGFWSHDIGGFEGKPPTDVYKRWIAFGLLSSHSRLHGSSSYRVPWLFDEEAVEVLRFFTQLKHRLMPYLYAKAVEASKKGTPVLRAMVLEFPNDPACGTLDTQFMLGDSLLVAPIFTSEGTVSYYLPEGKWTHFLTGEVRDGGRWYQEQHGFLSLPLYVRPNTVLAVGTRDDTPEYDWVAESELCVYALEEGRDVAVTVPKTDGTPGLITIVRRDGGKLTVTANRSLDTTKIVPIGLSDTIIEVALL